MPAGNSGGANDPQKTGDSEKARTAKLASGWVSSVLELPAICDLETWRGYRHLFRWNERCGTLGMSAGSIRTAPELSRQGGEHTGQRAPALRRSRPVRLEDIHGQGAALEGLRVAIAATSRKSACWGSPCTATPYLSLALTKNFLKKTDPQLQLKETSVPSRQSPRANCLAYPCCPLPACFHANGDHTCTTGSVVILQA